RSHNKDEYHRSDKPVDDAEVRAPALHRKQAVVEHPLGDERWQNSDRRRHDNEHNDRGERETVRAKQFSDPGAEAINLGSCRIQFTLRRNIAARYSTTTTHTHGRETTGESGACGGVSAEG